MRKKIQVRAVREHFRMYAEVWTYTEVCALQMALSKDGWKVQIVQ